MGYQDIVKRAWIITQEHRYLRSFGTLTSFFFLLIGAARIRYILPQPFGTIRDIEHLLEEYTTHPVQWLAVYLTVYVLVYLLSFVTHILAEGGLIASIAKIEKRGLRLSFGKVFALGMHYFLPLVEFRSVTALLDITRYILIMLLIRFYARAYGFYEDTIFYKMTWFWVVLGVFILILSFFLTYAEYHLVIRKAGIFKSMKKSITLVTFHFTETLFISIITGLVVLRTLINLVLVFLIPVAVFYLVSFLTSTVSMAVGLSVGGTIALVLFWLSARIAGVLLVFTTTIWTLMYFYLDEQNAHVVLEESAEEDADEDAEAH